MSQTSHTFANTSLRHVTSVQTHVSDISHLYKHMFQTYHTCMNISLRHITSVRTHVSDISHMYKHITDKSHSCKHLSLKHITIINYIGIFMQNQILKNISLNTSEHTLIEKLRLADYHGDT